MTVVVVVVVLLTRVSFATSSTFLVTRRLVIIIIEVIKFAERQRRRLTAELRCQLQHSRLLVLLRIVAVVVICLFLGTYERLRRGHGSG